MVETMNQFAETAPWFVALLSAAVTEGRNRKRALRVEFLSVLGAGCSCAATPSSDNLENQTC